MLNMISRYVALHRSLGRKFSAQDRLLRLYADFAAGFGDRYTNIQRIYVSGLANATDAVAALTSQTGIEARELVDQARLNALGAAASSVAKSQRWRLAGVMGALSA